MPSTAFLLAFMMVIKEGMSMGKLSTAMIPRLPLVFEAMEEMRVRMAAKQELPMNMTNRKDPTS